MLKAKFNDGSELFAGQCVAFKKVCSNCGAVFEEDAAVCSKCKKPRERCKNISMANEETCRIHAQSRYMSIYAVVAAAVADTTLDEMIEKGNLRDLTAEFALAKLAIAELHGMKTHPGDRIEALAQFFNIAKTLQTIETGGILNTAWSDPLVTAMRAKFRQLVGVVVDIIAKYVIDESTKRLMLMEFQDRAKMVGNSVTVKPVEGNVDQVLALREPSETKRVISSVIPEITSP